MISVTSILVPVDFSPASEMALHYGLSLALQFHARTFNRRFGLNNLFYWSE